MSIRRSRHALSFFVSAAVLVGAASEATAAPISPDKTDKLPPPNEPYKPPPPTWSKPGADGFYWAAEPRAHLWAAAWRSQTWPEKTFPAVQSYDPEYVHPKSWKLLMEGCVTNEDWELTRAGKTAKNVYTWSIDGVVQASKSCSPALSFPAQGDYRVTLAVAGKTFTQAVRVKDLLIVALGDSMSSGEGSPDLMQFHGTPSRPADWVDRQCHRSKSGPAAQAAQAIERMDATTSVTFISFACSGATIDRSTPLDSHMFNPYVMDTVNKHMSGSGLLGGYAGIEAPAGEEVMDIVEYKDKGGKGVPAQVDQLKHALAGKRKADAIVLSVGLNDANFSSMMYTCAVYSDCPSEGVGPAASKMSLAKRFESDVKPIPDSFKRLGEAINPLSKRVLMFEYPNVFTGDDKKTCGTILEDAKFSFLPAPLQLSVTAFESNWIQSNAGPLMLNALKAGAQSAGFDYIQGSWDAFRGHGYCASQNQRWINRATDSDVTQGPSTSKAKGTIHPNFFGYYQLSTFVLKNLTGRDANTPPRGRPDTYAATSNKLLKVDAFAGVLGNDYDLDLLSNLTVKSYTQPNGGSAGKVEVQPDGSFVYNPAGFVGTAKIVYIVTDGIHDGTGSVTFNVTAGAVAGPPTFNPGHIVPVSHKP
jgi:hypothetical protein